MKKLDTVSNSNSSLELNSRFKLIYNNENGHMVVDNVGKVPIAPAHFVQHYTIFIQNCFDWIGLYDV